MFQKGAKDEDVAFYLGVSRSTLNLWKERHPEFSDAMRLARDRACVAVTQSLFERATGYSHKAHKFFNHDGVIIAQEYTEFYPPDTAAGIFLLKNWRPDLWKDKQQIEQSAPELMPVEEMSAEEIDRQLARLEQAKSK